MKSLEASEQEAKQREENFAELMREYTQELKEVKYILFQYSVIFRTQLQLNSHRID